MPRVSTDDMLAKIGEVIGTSEWIAIEQDRINQFADATGDHQFIHLDAEKAKMTPFGGTIAHGFLTLSLLPYLMAQSNDLLSIDGVKMGVNYGIDKLRFLSPVKSGKRVRGVFTLGALIEKRPGQWQQTLECSVEIEGEEKPALIASWINQVFI